MSISRTIKKSIVTILIIIEIILLSILYIKNPFPEYMINYIGLFTNLTIAIVIIFIISVICYVLEHKKYNKNENILDENLIHPEFDVSFKGKDILYLSTILKKQYPDKKEIILLIMQLINKKIIDLSSYWNGKNYQYIIEKRTSTSYQISNIENNLLNYLFKSSNKVDLLHVVKNIYSKKNSEILSIIKQISIYMEQSQTIQPSLLKTIYKILTVILSIVCLFLGICIFLTSTTILTFDSSIEVIIIFTLLAFLCIFIAFICTLLLKKFNKTYQLDNDGYSWFCKNVLFIFTLLIISYLFPVPYLVHFFMIVIYLFTTLTIMIKYNVHISLSQSDIVIRNKLISLKNYFKYMNYLKDKEFGNIITYEECIMYGFLFNITIKINKEFDLLQKELLNIVKKESYLYFRLFKNNIL